jgi:hypothetical protein
MIRFFKSKDRFDNLFILVVKLYLLKVFFDWFDCWRFVDFKIIGKLPEFDHLLA